MSTIIKMDKELSEKLAVGRMVLITFRSRLESWFLVSRRSIRLLLRLPKRYWPVSFLLKYVQLSFILFAWY